MSTPRVLIRSTERGPDEQSSHPWNPASEVHGWALSRLAGLGRIAVNLLWLPPGRESFAYHRHYREEEWVYVLDGHGVALIDDREHQLGAGDFFGFAPGVAHLLRNTGSTPLHYLAGGEVVNDVEVADFPSLGRRMVRAGNHFTAYARGTEVPFLPGPLAPEPRSTARVAVRLGERTEPLKFNHPDNPKAEVFLTALSRPAGLKRVAVVHSRVPEGRESYAFHLHHHDEEWMYVLEGRGVVEVGEVEHELGPGDFAAFPAGGPPHNARAVGGELICVQGGDAWSRSTIEIVDFPRAGLRRTMVGTKNTLTFALDQALERRR